MISVSNRSGLGLKPTHLLLFREHVQCDQLAVFRLNDYCRSDGDQQYHYQALVQGMGSWTSQDSDDGEISSSRGGVVSYLSQAQAKAVLSPIVSNCVK